MTHCAKCGAELIGSRKFCAACGAPAGDPRSPAASTGLAPVMSGRGPGATPSAPGSAPGSSPSNPGSSPSGPASNRGGSGPAIQYAPPPPPGSQVNPFAQTAGPLTNRQRAPDYGPPPSVPAELGMTTPGVGEPGPQPDGSGHSPSHVSPLAVSNVNSSRGAFENAITSGPASTAAVAAGLVGVITHPENDPSQGGVKRSAVAGTQMMPSSANPGAALPGGAPSAAGGGAGVPSKRQDRTQLLAAFPPGTVPRPGAAPAPPAAPPAAPSAGAIPVADPQRISSVPNLQSAAAYAPPPPPPVQPPQQTAPVQPPMHPSQPAMPPMQPPQPLMQPSAVAAPGPWSPASASYAIGQPSPVSPYAAPAAYSQQPPMPPQPMAPPPPAPGYGFGFAYVPGSRVTVTWSNGGRYPGTVQQVSGTACLVMFPDGQQHWVEMQYIAPA